MNRDVYASSKTDFCDVAQAASGGGKCMTNLEAAAMVAKLYAERARDEFSAINKYAEAVAVAIMALNRSEEEI